MINRNKWHKRQHSKHVTLLLMTNVHRFEQLQNFYPKTCCIYSKRNLPFARIGVIFEALHLAWNVDIDVSDGDIICSRWSLLIKAAPSGLPIFFAAEIRNSLYRKFFFAEGKKSLLPLNDNKKIIFREMMTIVTSRFKRPPTESAKWDKRDKHVATLKAVYYFVFGSFQTFNVL